MIILEIGNSFSTIKGLTPAQEKSLMDALSYTVDAKAAYFSKSFGPRKKSLLTKKGEFPTGLLSRVRTWYKNESIGVELKDNRIKPGRPVRLRSPWTGLQPYSAQTKALEAVIRNGRGTVSIPTGGGKSMLIAMIAQHYGLKTLVVVPSLEIKRQLKESMSSFNNVTIENIDSSALTKCKDYDFLIIDEAHHVSARTYQKLNKMVWAGIYYRVFLTATPFRNIQDETLLFEAIAGDVIYKLSYKDAVAQKMIVPIESYYYEVPRIQPEGFTYQQVYSELVVNNRTRNEMIAITLLRLQEARKSTLCLVQEVAHGKALADITGLPFVSGSDAESRDYIQQFNSGEINVLIATSGIMGEGIDSRPCEYVVVAGLGKAKSRFMQQVGRAVRKYPGKESAKVIIYLDRSHKWTKNHFLAQKKILLEEYGVLTSKLEL